MKHKPVMLTEMLEAIAPREGGIYLDGTFGAGGYSEAILKAADCKVYAIDRDPNVAEIARELEAAYPGRFIFIAGNFSEMAALLAAHDVAKVDGIVLDIGVSSMQLDVAERGFSFAKDGPLDMRMGASGKTAAYIVNHYAEETLADLIYHYGEEKFSRRIARAIVAARNIAPIETTLQLANIIAGAVPRKMPGLHPATRSFQAIRILVNDELGELERALKSSLKLLKQSGRLVVITFHSLEDRIVKHFIQSHQINAAAGSRHLPPSPRKAEALLEPLYTKPRLPTEEETATNARARSAKLRSAIFMENAL